MSQDAPETESEKHIRNTLNKPWNSYKRKSWFQTLSHIRALICLLRIHRWIFPGKAKHRRILSNSKISRGKKLHKVWVIVASSRSRKLDFLNKRNLFHQFIYITIICSPMLLIHFSFSVLVNESDFSRQAPTRFSPLLFMFLWILFLTKYDKIM